VRCGAAWAAADLPPRGGAEIAPILVEADVLVVGGGAGAARAAVAAAQAGARTIVALKKTLGRSGATNYPRKGAYGSAWQASDGCGGADDSPEVHYQDIMRAALGMADARMARTLAHESPERLLEIEAWGFRLIGDPEGRKRHYSGYSCFGTQPRAHGMMADESGGHTGNMVAVLAERFAAAGGVVHQNMTVVDLLLRNGVCVGALAIDPDGELVEYRAGAVILATGGASQMFPLSTTPGEITGDGYGMAFRAGAELVNLEFMQYMWRPVHGEPPDIGGPWWSLEPVVRAADGEEMLGPTLPPGTTAAEVFHDRTLHYPFSSRDRSMWLDVAVQRAIRAGRGTARGGVLIDFSSVDVATAALPRPQHRPLAPTMAIVDPVVEVTHAAHAINGGIRVDEHGQSAVPGLFAVGETIAGPHGADRLGGGMLAACNVFGARAGRRAAEHAAAAGRPAASSEQVERVLARLASFRGGSAVNWGEIRRELKALTAGALLVVRSGDGLRGAIERMRQLRLDALPRAVLGDATTRVHLIETENLLLAAELMARAALWREESRGSHFREDFPRQDDARWLVNVVWRSRDGEPAPTLSHYRQDPDAAAQMTPA
jgi:fumarate reductase (CoM/CoB) subunit A